jgi:hypothetical protein
MSNETASTAGQKIAADVMAKLGSNTVRRGPSPLDVSNGIKPPVQKEK